MLKAELTFIVKSRFTRRTAETRICKADMRNDYRGGDVTETLWKRKEMEG